MCRLITPWPAPCLPPPSLYAPPPQVLDVYLPGVFKRSAPDPVAYRIAMLEDQAAFPTVAQVQAAVAASPGVPVRWAGVDEGNVAFFDVLLARLLDSLAAPQL